MARPDSYTGRERLLRNRAAVRMVDALAQRVLTVVGIGTIAAVLLVCVFLLYVSLPLFQRPAVSDPTQRSAALGQEAPRILRTDEYNVLGWTALADGTVDVLRLDTGEIYDSVAVGAGNPLTAHAFPAVGERVALGYGDGTVQLGEIGFSASVVAAEAVPEAARGIAVGESHREGTVLYSRSDTGWRQHRFRFGTEPPVTLSEGAAVRFIDTASSGSVTVLGAVTNDGMLHVRSVREQSNMLTGEVTLTLSGGSVALAPGTSLEDLKALRLFGGGNALVLVWQGGETQRYDTRNIAAPVLAEKLDLVPDPEAQVSALEFLLGQQTLLVGDSTGLVGAWFLVREEENPRTPDGWVLVRGHVLPGQEAAVTALASSQRTRTALLGYADGSVRLYNVTTERLLAEMSLPGEGKASAVALAPKDNAVVVLGGGQLARWDIDMMHPEGAMSALFRPVWYEGMPGPQHIWQSSSGDDAFEPKLGLVPLIFGTLKATLYAMLFGVPVALLAAIYTSEFLAPRLKTVVKPTIELMASLPSVVLGFIAALVLAPLVENIVPSILAGTVLVPVALLFGAQCWQILPQRTAQRLVPYRLCFVFLALVVAMLAAGQLGPVLERYLFEGDFRHYLTGQVGSGVSAWLLLLVPLSAGLVVLLNGIWLGPLIRVKTVELSRTGVVLVDFARFCVSVVAALVLAFAFAALLNAWGFDPRGGASYVGTYVQRNAMVVGFVMGFAIIPIIYTIAEDALSTVPEHLRAASLGAGATHWQTAIRIVLPAAMSGLFSAIMIGLGRAVGETMIVLMAAGNTPVLEWNVFSGLRTLAANIAVELPEAPKDGTHYRTLFMAALVLFLLTFAVNTVAELVRLRFRKQARSL